MVGCLRSAWRRQRGLICYVLAWLVPLALCAAAVALLVIQPGPPKTEKAAASSAAHHGVLGARSVDDVALGLGHATPSNASRPPEAHDD